MNPDRGKDRAGHDQDAEATQFITLESIQDEAAGSRRRGLLLAAALGVLVALALLAAVAYVHHGHPAPARAEARP